MSNDEIGDFVRSHMTKSRRAASRRVAKQEIDHFSHNHPEVTMSRKGWDDLVSVVSNALTDLQWKVGAVEKADLDIRQAFMQTPKIEIDWHS